jgi:arsenate reductase
MNINELTLFEKIENFCKEIEKEFDLISEERKEKLLSLRDYISGKIGTNQIPKLIVICTHNSRRSHIGQIWLAVGMDYFQLPEIQTFSGGTEATAFNIRAVNAFQKIGFQITTKEEKTENPIYQINWKNETKPYPAFSKKYEDEPNPKEKFGAIMVCSEADAGCPIVSGCDFRLSLPYDDPKAFDETDLEEKKYGERVRQIGREILFVLSQVK